jgi:predicted exporter
MSGSSGAVRERTRVRGIAIAVWIVGVAACIAIVANTRFTADMSAFLPRNASAEQQILVDQLRDGALSRLLLVGIEGGDAASRARISRAVAETLRKDDAFAAVHNGDPAEFDRDRAYFFANRYLLSAAVTPERFTVAGLRAAIGDSIDLLASPAGMMLKSVLPRDPTGEIVALTSDLAGAPRPLVVDGAWASPDGTRAILIAETRASGSDLDAQQVALERVRAAFGRALAASQAPAGNATLLLSGTGVFAVASRATIQREVTRLSIVSTALIVALLLAVYRSPTALALGLVPVASGALAAVAAVSVAHGFVHGLTLGFGTTLIGEAIDYSIYLFILSNSSTAQSNGRDDRDWVTRFWPTIRLGVLTSVCGFATLLVSGFPGLAQLGLYSITGLAVAALVTRFVLPSLLPRRFRVRDLTPLGIRLDAAIGSARRARWALGIITAAAVVVLVVHRDTLWNRELAALSPVSPADQALDQRLRADLGAPDARYLVIVSAASFDGALAASERIAAALQPLVERGVLGGFDAPSRFLPSAATQRARQAALPPRPELAARLREATAGLPLRAERLEPFLVDAEAARTRVPLTRAELAGTSLAHAVDALVVRQGERWSAMLPLRAPADRPAIDAAVVRAALAGPATRDALFVDIKDEADRLYGGYLQEAIRLSAAGFAVIVALLGIVLRDWRRVLAVLAPLVAAVLVVAAGFALAGAPLILLHLVGMLLIVAIGSNYALFFDRGAAGPAGSDDGSRPRMLASLLTANLTTVAGFGLLAFSSVPVLSALGATVGPGAILVLAFAAILSARR